ncbi:4-hydroxythreonine-4-phosphate dehydrogenase PdxA [Iocasia frigidifontis]|uniref:4-hydroxythreonine-4-phosphate dehydrogenase PdxA n=1 Tax=Iocasia fonsfrigidae TaxID=2682810 RepID=A0A8A7KD59_9FIRM|nr:4-hydroxythreonine-4-phosphate dehydrogenase PdxA [Iocasia fonsfrigidae]QTL99793.1 4-hydroxythreonine-4-phosphate dehydrogenase PdxA [Iocasia fonsfrigidae]
MDKPIIAITMGDPAGIGAEIAVRALGNREIYERAKPLVIGSRVIMEDAINYIPSNLKLNVIEDIGDVVGKHGLLDLLDLDNIGLHDFKYGEVSAAAGKASVEYILKGIELAMDNRVAAVVTGPIHKEAINQAGFKYAGHTEIFAEKTKAKDYAMMLTSEDMKVIHVSTHVSLRKACDLVKKDRVLKVIELAHQALLDLGIAEPRIAVAGLNPHSGEQGLFGREEIDEIIPAIEEAAVGEIKAEGPVPPDTIFSKVQGGMYDIAVVMYHDQGHIPMKVTGFKYNKETDKFSSVSGVNTTVGLPIIRTSVDHGTAYDKAGEGRANEESLVEAFNMAIDFAKNRY